MSLEIDQLVSTVRVPARRRELAWMVERVGKESLGRALKAHLGPSLDRAGDVVLLDRLDVQVQLSSGEVSEEALIEAWTRAIGVALLGALEGARGDAAGTRQRFDSEAAWVAEMAVRAARGFEIARWKLPQEAAAARGAGRAAAVLAILRSRIELLEDVLDELERKGLLEAVLGVLDELGLEELVRACSQRATGGGRAIAWEQIVEVARVSAAESTGMVGTRSASHGFALRLFVLLRRRAGAPETARAILHILRALRVMAATVEATAERLESIAASHGVPGEAEVLRQIAAQWRQYPECREELLKVVRSPANAAAGTVSASVEAGEPRVRVRTAGLFLLADVVRRLEWDRIAMPDGVRAVSYLLAGAASTLLDGFDAGFATLDESAALFAGLGNEPDFAGLRHFYSSATAAERAELAARLRLEVASGEWGSLCDAAAARLAAELAMRVRGFGRASAGTIKRQLLRAPGTVQLGGERVVVTLDPCPWNIALHISGRDETISHVAWLGGRSLEIVLEGL